MRAVLALLLALTSGQAFAVCATSHLSGQWILGFAPKKTICSVPNLELGKGGGTCSFFQSGNTVTHEEPLDLVLTVSSDCLVEGSANGKQLWGTLDPDTSIVTGGIADTGAFMMTRHH